MENSLSNWQDALNDGLVNRLTRPLRQPGMMNRAMGQRIINRCDRFLTRLPLLNQQMQRWGNTNSLSSESIPIIYAQPIPLTKEQHLEIKRLNSQPIVSQEQPTDTIIQRKFDSSQSLPTKTASNIIPVENSIDLSNSNLTDETSQFLTLETQINQTSISDPKIPVVSPLPHAEQLLKTVEMGLAGLTELPIPSPIQSEFNLNYPSQQLDVTSISVSEIPVVSPLPNSEQLPKTAEIGLVGLTELPISSPTQSEFYPNYPSQQLDATSISDPEIPVVSPLPHSEQLPKPKEMLPLKEFVSVSDQTLPIIQAKLQNYSQSPSSLAIVNSLNMLVTQQQAQQNHLENLSSTKQENLISQSSSKLLPLVTAQPLKSQNNWVQQDISSMINYSPHDPHQNATLINTQPINISTSQINQTNNKENVSPLPLVTVTSPNNSSLKAQSLPLPLAKTNPSSRSNSQQPNLSSRNSISNTDSSSTPRNFASSLSPTETSVSTLATRNVDIDINAIASQVERKLMRKLVIESERRGKNR